MECALKDLLGKNCFVFLDDIIHSSDLHNHFNDLQLVLFFQTKITFLSDVVSAEGVQTDPDKTLAINDFPVPTCLKGVQLFWGMTGWYHRENIDFMKCLLNFCDEYALMKIRQTVTVCTHTRTQAECEMAILQCYYERMNSLVVFSIIPFYDYFWYYFSTIYF